MMKFYYPINLHYSQTSYGTHLHFDVFYYPINLHYSQTIKYLNKASDKFYYPINLHYSQTNNGSGAKCL